MHNLKDQYCNLYQDLKKNNPSKLRSILNKYAPVFDKYIAVYYEYENILPPVCNACGCRVSVSKNQPKLCSECHRNKDKFTIGTIRLQLKDNIEVLESKKKYIASGNKIKFRCKIHNHVYSQMLDSALSGHQGCKYCKSDAVKSKINYPVSQWIDTAKKVHNNFYDYSKSEDCARYNDKVTIICPTHGEFKQQISLHLNGHKCKQCGLKINGQNRRLTQDEFLDRANKVHNNKYDYTKAVYTHMTEKITITCQKHGDFIASPVHHIYNQSGCPSCNYTITQSKAEFEIIEFLKNECNITNIEHSYRDLGFEIDIYLPDFKLGIEYNGLYWHSSNNKESDRILSKKHLSKTIKAEENNIHLLHIFEHEWNTKKEIWKSVIKQKLGQSTKLYARQCQVIKLNSFESSIFFDMNHLQGVGNRCESIALVFKGEIVAALVLTKARYTKDCNYEILRYANKRFTSVIGGFSRLLKHAMKGKSGKVVSYANRRWSVGDVYKTNNFTLVNISDPCYYYWKSGDMLEHRSAYMKHMLKEKLSVYDPVLSEVDNMYVNGYRRIWDCGTLVFVKEFKGD